MLKKLGKDECFGLAKLLLLSNAGLNGEVLRKNRGIILKK